MRSRPRPRLRRPASPPRAQNQRDDITHTPAMPNLRKNDRPTIAHGPRIALHNPQIRTDRIGEVALIDHEQVATRDAGPALAGDFVAAGDVDDIDDVVG